MDSYAGMFLQGLGYRLPDSAQGVIAECELWYRNAEAEKHRRSTVNGEKYELIHMGFGKRVCSDDASLCEVVEINAGGESEAQYDAVNALLQDNQFAAMYRRQLELCAALGTEACYVRMQDADVLEDGAGNRTLQGGQVRLNYIDAGGFYPLTVENGEVQEAAFVGSNLRNGKRTTTLVVCTRPEANYQYRTVVFDENGGKLSDETDVLGEVKPFAVLRTADVNNLSGMTGYGLPKLKNAIPVLLALDATWSAFYGDIDTAEKITLINEVLCKFDDNGQAITPNEQIKRRFVMLGERLPDQQNVIKEIVPEVRVDVFRDTIELLLSMLSMQFGYGLKKYRFEQGEITTATQYAGERQDQLQELNKQREEAKAYIQGIIRAALWFENTFQGTAWDIDAEVTVEFDDSYVTDRESQLVEMRNDVLAGIGGVHVAALYLREKYNLSDEEALQWAQGDAQEANEDEDDNTPPGTKKPSGPRKKKVNADADE